MKTAKNSPKKVVIKIRKGKGLMPSRPFEDEKKREGMKRLTRKELAVKIWQAIYEDIDIEDEYDA